MDQTIPMEEQKAVRTESFLCPNCGGSMKYDIKKQQYCCESCGTPGEIIPLHPQVQEYDLNGYRSRESSCVAFEGTACAFCQSCGAQIVFGQYDTATICPMCGSTQIDVKKQESGVPPEGIVPFRLDKADAQQSFRQWIKKRWFAPNALKKSYQEGALTGLYIPFWTYDAQADGWFSGRGGHTTTYQDKDGHTHTRTNWTPVTGPVSNYFNDIQICASEKSNSKYLSQVLPYDTITDCKPYSPQYISGFEAEKYALKADDGFTQAQDIIRRELESQAHDYIMAMGYDQAQVSSVNFTCTNVTYKHVLLPLWSAVFHYKNKLYQYLINGETGKVSGGRPYSAPKIAIAVTVAVAVVVGICLLANSDDVYAAEYRREPLPAAQVQEYRGEASAPMSEAQKIVAQADVTAAE